MDLDSIPQRLTRHQASTYLRRRYAVGSYAYLQKLATVGGGPVFEKCGGSALYLITDLDDWAQNRPDGRTVRYKKPAAEPVVTSNEGGGNV
jgi:hypothetical protein